MELNGKIIIYGAGNVGRELYDFLSAGGYSEKVYGFCDRNYLNISQISDKKVYGYQEVKTLKLPFIVAVADQATRIKIGQMLESDGNIHYSVTEFKQLLQEDHIAYNRACCAYTHLNHMDSYFFDAEKQGAINTFWGKDSPFFSLFQQLDLTNVIELACGRGRHVPHYIRDAKAVTLVDILQKNIDICKTRYCDFTNITYYCNNGYNLEKLESNRYTSLFSYDSVVHFEMMDIFEYLKDIKRVLVTGGKALIHHSNYHDDYRVSFSATPTGRNYMSKDLFAYLAYRLGLQIVTQQIIDWGSNPSLDCITLLQK